MTFLESCGEIPQKATRPFHERHFDTHDGQSLYYRHWPTANPNNRRGTVIMFHRGHEHSGRMTHLVDELELEDFDFFAWDARGHGNSPGARGYAPSFSCSVRDVETFIHHIEVEYKIAKEEMIILAQSMSAILVSTWIHDYAPPVRALILASPAFRIKLYVPFAQTGLKLLQAIRGNFFIKSYVKSKYLSHDLERQRSYDTDPLISRAISVNILLELLDTARRIVSDANAIIVPTLLFTSEKDWVVYHQPQQDFFERLGASEKEKIMLEVFLHDTFGEINRGPVITKMRMFIQQQIAKPFQQLNLENADKQGETCKEMQILARVYPPWSIAGMYWRFVRSMLDSWLGRLSDGISLGHETGFNSGSTLDYVYRNQASGKWLIGKFFDRCYLNAIGWRGIRQRKEHLKELLQTGISVLMAAGKPIHILDIAAGHGRYIAEALEQISCQPDSIILRDLDSKNVDAGQKLLQSLVQTKSARFEQGDAFNADQLAAISPKPTLAVVSGLYELFAQNAPVTQSLCGLASAVEQGGYLIYTGQPWHPQLEFIARALTGFDHGKAWIMRRRTQAELDQLVTKAGFKKIEQRIDHWGIFTVSIAQRL